MKVIDEVMAHIEEHQFSHSTKILAQAMKSLCTGHPGPPLWSVTLRLDDTNYNRYCRLAWIMREPDFDGADGSSLARAHAKLLELGFYDEDV